MQLKGATFSCVESVEASLAFPLTSSVILNSLINKQVTDPSGQPNKGLDFNHFTKHASPSNGPFLVLHLSSCVRGKTFSMHLCREVTRGKRGAGGSPRV